MNFADNFKQEQKGSEKKKKVCSSAAGGGRVDIKVPMDPEELDDTIKLTKKEICQSAVCTLGNIYHVFKTTGRPIDFETRDFLDTIVSQVLEDIFLLDDVGGEEAMNRIDAVDYLFEAYKKKNDKKNINFSDAEQEPIK